MNSRLAIVGCGPRGLFAIEALLHARAGSAARSMSISVFDNSRYPGSGPNYAPDQTPLNLLNIPLRNVPLRARDVVSGAQQAFPSFQQWYAAQLSLEDEQEDPFPPRADVGSYLMARLASVLDTLPEHTTVNLLDETVRNVTRSDKGLKVHTANDWYGDFDHVLLTIGHQTSELDPNLCAWQAHAHRTPVPTLFTQPYPTEPICASPLIRAGSTVALRGMGLSMIDVVKSLTEGRGGHFKRRSASDYVYSPSGREARYLLPFSLDGLPLAPKPLNEVIDQRFAPAAGELETLEEVLQNALHDPDDEALHVALVRQMGMLSTAVFDRLPSAFRVFLEDDAAAIAVRWLEDDATAHGGIVPIDAATDVAMRRFLLMATAEAPASLDYCIGQVWRHAQPVLYRCLSHSGARTESIAPAISLDRRMKRYAFGPPASSVAQLLALHDADLLRFVVADDPDIQMRLGGWELREGDAVRLASVMIDTVLDSTSLNTVNSALVSSLVEAGVLQSVNDDLGARTRKTGEVVSASAHTATGISLIGRLATGSIFEADALDDCTGPDIPRWAEHL